MCTGANPDGAGDVTSEHVPVTRTDWKTQPLSEPFAEVDLDIEVSEGVMERIRLGLLPEQMEDKWFLYYEHPHLHAHRSWTGFAAFILTFEQRGSAWRIVGAKISQDPAHVNFATVEEGIHAALETVAVCLLGDSPKDLGDNPTIHWGAYGRAILGEGPEPGKPNQQT